MTQDNLNDIPDGFGFCGECAQIRYTCDIGTCQSCGKNTASGLFDRCRLCAFRELKCMACGKDLSAPDDD